MRRRNLFIIPARGGSKGLPGKNIRALGGKPMIVHTIHAAQGVATSDDVICVSTDAWDIAQAATAAGAPPPFTRPAELATDTADSRDVLLHAIDYYENLGERFDRVVLLQPTSPFRNAQHIREAIDLYDRTPQVEMVVSVKETSANPYFVLAEEDAEGWLQKSKTGSFSRRQDCPRVWEYNGAVYILSPESLRKCPMNHLRHVKKYIMNELDSVDIDTPLDWAWAEFILERNFKEKA
ncbi:MAG: CMP-N-acetylneuraminic acid synthetase [Bdellovibrionales bacterium RIFOXYC1_FULL_54_43]|nr:MAG: CMP-N-acetylneuraminic acid synthetase [Bdellovibrionales bacterium RIFOXYC1_FULL_54_43]OFZ83948.1 MAG: CMP-N-acetylneuraminic acid synthetase [Bdellovibrionales bacterium RIFOXYD1_FULL_55_31]